MPVFKEITPIYEEVLGWQPRLFPLSREIMLMYAWAGFRRK